MHDFVFYSPTRFYFGRDAETRLGAALKEAGAQKILIHYGQGSVVRSGLLERSRKQLRAQGLSFVEFGGAVPNPHDTLVEEGAALCRRENVDYILALGGGSCLDSAKAIALAAVNTIPLIDIYLDKAKPDRALPVATVMTFPATGSEGSDSSVINFQSRGLKRGFSSDLIRPKLAFLNPELSYTLPTYQTFCGVTDMMAHIMERYFNETKGADISNAWSEALLREIMKAAYTVRSKPDDYDARATLMWASTIAHNGILSCGVEQEDWASHQLEHELSFLYDVAHGAGLAVVFPNWLRFAVIKKPEKIARFAREVFGIRGDYNALEAWGLRGIAALQRFFKDMGLPLTFDDLGCKAEDIPRLAASVKRDENGLTGGYIRLDEADCRSIYALCCEKPLI